MATIQDIRPQQYESKLLDGGVVRASLPLHKFDYIGGDCICRYTDRDGDECTARRSEGDLYDPNTGDWIEWYDE